MNALRAIVIDTWKQSQKQVVFLIMLALLGVMGLTAVILPQPFEQPDGTTRVGFVWGDGPSPILEEMWTGVYVQTLLLENGDQPNLFDPEAQEQNADLVEAAMHKVEAMDVPMDQRAVESFIYVLASGVFTISMLLFLAACAGYYPNMLEAGAIDIVLARPVDRLRIFLGKYIGGLALYAAAIVALYVFIYVGVGLRTGVWVWRLFLTIPLQVFCAGVLYAILAALGVIKRSATLCMVVGLIFYLVVDSVVGTLIQMQRMNVFAEMPWMDGIAGTMRATLPNFGLLKENATASVMNMPLMDWQPFAVASAWLVLMLGLGYWRFAKTDY